MAENLGLTESVAIALGGMIGGGIYAVLGVVAGITGPATWAAFVLAGIVAMGAGYAFNALNRIVDRSGGSVAFVEDFVGNGTVAGMVGWTLLFGYVGSMAMYAFAFAEFSVSLGLPSAVAGLPIRPFISVLAVAAFVGLNLLGAQATGSAENVLVALKVAILVAFGALGLVYALSLSPGTSLSFGTGQLASFGPIMAAAISFVAFQGWQLLFYDQDSIDDPVPTIRKAVYVSIPVAVLIYVLVGLVTVNLVPQAIEQRPHVALKDAASLMMEPYGLATAGGVLIALSALFSTGSAINATLYSAAHFAKGLLEDDLLPAALAQGDAADDADGSGESHGDGDDGDDGDGGGVPGRMVVLIGVVTAVFAAIGSLGAITSFASLAFILVFGAMSYLALRERDRDEINPVPPAVGLVGSASFFPLMLWHLYSNEPGTFVSVVVVAILVIGVELLYFEREVIEREVAAIEDAALGDDESLPPNVD